MLALLFAVSAHAQGVKWHPGHYVMLNGKGSLSEHLKHIDEIGDEPSIEGVVVRIWWAELEPYWNDYDFSRINTYLWKLKQQPTKKRLIVRVMDREFNTSSAWGIVPKYLRNDPIYNGGLVRTRTGYAARLWEPRVMDRLIALYKNLGWRYDSEPLFEGVLTEESTLSLKSWDLPWNYTNDKLAWQYTRFLRQVKPAMPQTNLFMNLNWIGSSDLMKHLVQEVRDNRAALAGSNVAKGNKTLAQKVLTGWYGADYRWEVPIAHGVETAELGGWLGDYKPWENNTHSYYELNGHHLFWVRNTWQGDSDQRWYTGILPYLRSNPPTRTRCPNNYGWCITWN